MAAPSKLILSFRQFSARGRELKCCLKWKFKLAGIFVVAFYKAALLQATCPRQQMKTLFPH